MSSYHILYKCVLRGNLERVMRFIEDGLDPNHDGGKATIIASSYGHLDILEYLVAKGAILTHDALVSASKEGHLLILEFILTLPYIDPSEPNNMAIEVAYINNETTIVSRLLYHESKIQNTLLEEEYMRFHTEILSHLRPSLGNCAIVFVEYPIPIIIEIVEQLVDFAIYVPYHIKWNMIMAIKHSELLPPYFVHLT